MFVGLSLAPAAMATTYYVSPTGDDGKDGLTEANAWATIDNGDQHAWINPGDTVKVLAGTYILSDIIQLQRNGTAASPIVYCNWGGTVVIDNNNRATAVFEMSGKHTKVTGFIITKTGDNGITIQSDSCVVSNCRIYNIDKYGIRIVSNGNLIQKNVIYNTGDDGILAEAPASYSKIYGNTIYGSLGDGMELKSNTQRAFNNICVGSAGYGIRGVPTLKCGFNDIWNNALGNYLSLTDSAGGMSVNPLFVNAAAGDFTLQASSPVIDKGLDLGYPFVGDAPEMGAEEYIPTAGRNYFASPTGDDDNDGLSPISPWASIANGDTKGILNPGDTVNVMAGTFSVTSTITLSRSGTAAMPIVYQPHDDATPIVDMNGTAQDIVHLNGDHTIFRGLTLTDGGNHALQLNGDSCFITECTIYNFSLQGVDIYGSYNLIQKNLIYDAGQSGLVNRAGAQSNKFYGNTVYNCGLHGVWINATVTTCRVFNNILAINDIGIYGSAGNICGFNDIWNGINLDYSGGVSDSAGGLSVNPLFVDAPADNFALQTISPVIDRGLDLGYAFFGPAPDMGYFETGNHLPVLNPIGNKSTTENANLYFGIAATDVESIPVLTTSPLPTGALFTDNGDGTGAFDWTPTYMQAGLYDIIFYATDDVLALDSEVVTITVVEAGNQLPVLIIPFEVTVNENENVSFGISATDAESTPVLTASTLPNGASFTDNGDGTGDFDWTPNFLQAGVYEITFYATDDSSAVDSGITTVTVNEVGNQHPVLAAIGDKSTTENSNLNFDISATDIESIPALTTSTLPTGAAFIDNGDGTGSFDWTPLYPASGDYDITFYATDDSAAVDSEIITITVNPAALVSLQVAPDSALITTDSTLQFSVVGLDAGGFETAPGTITWGITEPLGDIDAAGFFDPTTVGTARVYALSDLGPVDTTDYLEVTPGLLNSLVISPDMTDTAPGDTVQFEATGFDTDGNAAAVGNLTWKVLGRMGTIDNGGQFVATKPGSGEIVVLSDINNVTDTSGSIDVEALMVYNIPMGNMEIRPGQEGAPVLIFRVENYFDDAKTLTDITVRDNCSGPGTAEQLRANVELISLYMDIDNDSLLGVSDSLMATAPFDGDANLIDFNDCVIQPDSGITLIVAIDASLSARDGDTLDVYFTTATDITVADATIPLGPAMVNSFGHGKINGMIAEQIQIMTGGLENADAGTFAASVLTFDLPRNGYQTDTLKSLNIYNVGTATADDIESLVLYKDNGNNMFTDADDETRLGNLVFTGDRWSISGLNVALTEPANRFYIGANIADYPINGATIALAIPVDGVQMASANDGPLDVATIPLDTVTIVSSENISCTVIPITPRTITPGTSTGPITAMKLVNGYSAAAYLDSLSFALIAADPNGATQNELDSQVDSVQLYLTSDNVIVIDANDSLLASSLISGGTGTFILDNLPVAGFGGEVRLVMVAWLNLYHAKNGNTLNLAVSSNADIYFNAPLSIDGEFPLTNPGNFIIETYPSEAVDVFDIDAGAYYGGQSNRPIFNFSLPSDGYDGDMLSSLTLRNLGTLKDAGGILTLKLWADPDGDMSIGIGDYIGQMIYANSAWSLTGVNFTIPPGGARFVVTANIANRSFDAGTVLLSIPKGGAVYASGTDGPDNAAVIDTHAHLVFPSNRITAISIPAATTTVMPGSETNNLMTFALYNGYLDKAKTLTAVSLNNISKTKSSPAFADHELGQISLYYDKDGSRTLGDDSLIANGNFSSGRLQLTGLDITLPPEVLTYFFITADIPLDVIDSDSLAIQITGPSDFSFSDVVNLNGELPLTTGGHLVIDGSIAAQYELLPVTPRTLSPSDTSVVLMAFKPVANGDRPDTLESLTIQNSETATDGDLETVELWIDDNDDDKWQDTDQLLGTFSYFGGVWNLDNINLEILNEPAAMFVIADIAADATPGASFRGRIPINGFEFNSGNDGPRDVNIIIGASFTISTSALRVSCSPLESAYSIGQNIIIDITVENLLAEILNGVSTELVFISDSELVTIDSSDAGPVDIPAKGSASFNFYLTAAAVGDVTFDLRAVAPLTGDTSAIVTTESITIQTIPSDAVVRLVNSIPNSVIRGQSSVFPLSVEISHSNAQPTSAPYIIQGLTLTVLDGSYQPVNASDVFSLMIMTTGFNILALNENPPDQPAVDFSFMVPVVVEPGEKKILSLLVSIDSLAAADDFALALADDEHIHIYDYNTMLSIPVALSVTFPLQTATCRIDDPSQQMLVSYTPLLPTCVNVGQDNVGLACLKFRHPGGATSSQIQLTELAMTFTDAYGQSIAAADVAADVFLLRQQTIIGGIQNIAEGVVDINVQLNSPLTLSPGDIDSLLIKINVAGDAGIAAFGMMIPDSTSFVVRDLSSGSILETASDDLLQLGEYDVFPIVAGPAQLNAPAIPPQMCPASLLPYSTVGGRDSLPLISFDFYYEAETNRAPITISSISLNVIDTLGVLLDPDRLFDRIGYQVEGQSVNYQSFVQVIGTNTVFNLGPTGITMNPGESLQVMLIADIEADAPYSNFVLTTPYLGWLMITDANDPSGLLPFVVADGCAASFPFTTEVTRIYHAAGRPILAPDNLPVQLAGLNQDNVTVFQARLDYSYGGTSGDVGFSGLTGRLLKRNNDGLTPIDAADLFRAVYLVLDDDVLATGAISADTVRFVPDTTFILQSGMDIVLKVIGDIHADAVAANYIMVFNDSTSFDLSDINMATTVYPLLSGSIFPLYSAEISLVAAGLNNTFVNYPNPFNPDIDGHTIIGYILDEDAHVDIEIFTVTGEAVKEILMNGLRTEGSHDEDIWTGLNDAGLNVLPGTYFCRITARYVSGHTESLRRKISIVR